jgi:hypothetical protein
LISLAGNVYWVISRKACEVRQYIAESGSLKSAYERAMLKAVRVKPKLQWRFQDIQDTRNV